MNDEAIPSPGPARPSALRRLGAVGEVLLCSDLPTQFALVHVLTLAGYPPLGMDGRLSINAIWLLVADAIVLIALIVTLLVLQGERPREVFLRRGRTAREIALGLALIPIVFFVVGGLLLLVQRVAPWLHNVDRNPLEDLIRTARDAWLFGLAAVLAGGLREEVQRGFILHRFEQYLGGKWVGLAVFSVAFGAGHLIQGWDAALVTGLLGLFWGALYLTRRNILAPVISHSGFNIAEILRHAAQLKTAL